MSIVPTHVDGLAVDREPWTRQPRETEAAWHAFQTWRDAPQPRSMVYVAETVGRKMSTLGTWSRRWNWPERTRAFDVWTDTTQLVADSEAIKEMNSRHAMIAKAMSAKVAARVNNLQIDELSPGEVGRWMQVIAMVERLARGEVTERHNVADTQVNVVNVDAQTNVVDTQHLAEVMDRLAARGIIPSPARALIDVDPVSDPPSDVISKGGVQDHEAQAHRRHTDHALHHVDTHWPASDVPSSSDAAGGLISAVDSRSDDESPQQMGPGTPGAAPTPPSGSDTMGPPAPDRTHDSPEGGDPGKSPPRRDRTRSHRRPRPI